MARQAQTAAAVLGALSIEPMSGYEIRQAITTVLGHFWHESFGQIYPCLAELERDGLVSATPGPRPRSSKYRITPSGRARLHDLLAEPPTPQPPRNGVLLRVFFGSALSRDEIAALLDEQEAAALGRLATYAGIRAGIAQEPDTAEHHRFWLATVRAGELAAQATVQWVTESRTELLPPASIPAS